MSDRTDDPGTHPAGESHSPDPAPGTPGSGLSRRDALKGIGATLGAAAFVAAVSPLLGLLGTVIGMVEVFTEITTHGVGNPTALAGGIAQALITTAAGLTVAIPSLIGYRYYRSRVDTLVVDMEKEAIKLVEALQRRKDKDAVK